MMSQERLVTSARIQSIQNGAPYSTRKNDGDPERMLNDLREEFQPDKLHEFIDRLPDMVRYNNLMNDFVTICQNFNREDYMVVG